MGFSIIYSYFNYLKHGILILLLNGCYAIGSISIEVIEPASVVIDKNINSVAVVNSAFIEPSTPITDNIQKSLYRLDTSIVQLTVQKLVQNLSYSPRFDTAIAILPINYRKPHNLVNHSLSAKFTQLGSNKGIDGIISANAISVTDTFLFFEYNNGYENTYQKSFALIIKSLWAIYNVENNAPVFNKVFTDTIILSNTETLAVYYKQLENNSFSEYLSGEIAGQIAQTVSGYIAPYWVTAYRDMYTHGHDSLVLAAQHAFNGNWLKAATFWQPLTKSNNKKLSAAACHNMALACEINGLLKAAEQWVKQAELNYPFLSTINYATIINKRLDQSRVLDKQFGINNN